MKPSPSPLAAATVDAFLELLFPPVAKDIPPQLLSLPLLQRHHFLNIQPENVGNYLIWPCKDQDEILGALHALPRPTAPADIRYSGDQETLFAHVYIRFNTTTSLRIVFLWDSPDNAWKYHNTARMPFPQPSFASVEDAWKPKAAVVHIEQADEHDSYWDSYGDSEEVPEYDHDALGVHHHKQDGAHTEDAYWAQYSAVHGSGDSTIPSPAPEKRKFQHEVSLKPNQHAVDLSDRLHALSSRTMEEETIAEEIIPEVAVEVPAKKAEPAPRIRKGDEAVREAIRGVYTLWKLGNVNGTESEFMNIVKGAVC